MFLLADLDQLSQLYKYHSRTTKCSSVSEMMALLKVIVYKLMAGACDCKSNSHEENIAHRVLL